MKPYDYLIVGAGLYGATFAYLARQAGKKCLVIDKRSHLGGNLYCESIHGINVHKYGAHIFHTNDSKIWDFVNSFVSFNRYTNCPLACYQGKIYNLPFNMNTFHQLWSVITPEEAKAIIDSQRISYESPQSLEEQALSLVGKDIYFKLVKGYTEKQWGRDCRDLPPFIIRRLPLRFVYDNNYFNDTYQGVPVGGYNKLIMGLLEGIKTMTSTDFFSQRDELAGLADTIVYTGMIDEYFDFKLGRLQYRSLRFETETLSVPNYQGNAVVNFTERSVPYTRIIEHKHFEQFGDAVYGNPYTVVTREYPTEYSCGKSPFYPINDEPNNRLYSQYKEMAQLESHVIFGGRLAEYKYYDMAPVISQVFDYWESLK